MLLHNGRQKILDTVQIALSLHCAMNAIANKLGSTDGPLVDSGSWNKILKALKRLLSASKLGSRERRRTVDGTVRFTKQSFRAINS